MSVKKSESTVMQESKPGHKLNYTTLSQEFIDYLESQLGPVKRMSISELQEMTAKRMIGTSASETLRQLREESR